MAQIGKNDPLVVEAKAKSQSGETREDVLVFLRQQTNSKVMSMAVLCKAQDITLQDAKRIVHFSKAWEDVRARDSDFLAALDQMDFEDEN